MLRRFAGAKRPRTLFLAAWLVLGAMLLLLKTRVWLRGPSPRRPRVELPNGAREAYEPETVALDDSGKNYRWIVGRTVVKQSELTQVGERIARRKGRFTPMLESPPEMPCTRRLLVAVITVAERQRRRDLIRAAFAASGVSSNVTLLFVLGRPPTPQRRATLDDERALHSDIHVLDAAENMDEGKTLEFFRSLNALPSHCFYFKQDDDTFVHYANLFERTRSLNESRPVYYGRSPFRHGFFAGWAYMLSAGFLRALPYPPTYTQGYEDQMVFHWSREVEANGRAVDYVREPERIHDFDRAPNEWRRPLANDAIAIHGLKRESLYLEALAFFFGRAAAAKARRSASWRGMANLGAAGFVDLVGPAMRR